MVLAAGSVECENLKHPNRPCLAFSFCFQALIFSSEASSALTRQGVVEKGSDVPEAYRTSVGKK